jgi:ketosteroid isomerase-like protein
MVDDETQESLMYADTRKPEPRAGDEPAARKIRPITRRRAMMLAAAAPLAVDAVQASSPEADAVADLVGRTELQAKAFMAGEMTRWFDLVRPIGDFTLMQPFGGPASHGFDGSPEHLAQLAGAFRNGDATLEIAATYADRNLVVLVMIERQHGEVHGLPNQDWSLRVTQIYRREGAEWRLAHRHADPLVRPLGLEQTAALARGE